MKSIQFLDSIAANDNKSIQWSWLVKTQDQANETAQSKIKILSKQDNQLIYNNKVI